MKDNGHWFFGVIGLYWGCGVHLVEFDGLDGIGHSVEVGGLTALCGMLEAATVPFL